MWKFLGFGKVPGRVRPVQLRPHRACETRVPSMESPGAERSARITSSSSYLACITGSSETGQGHPKSGNLKTFLFSDYKRGHN
ncbi:hypothetical protein RRG08_021555 [Elysia crispata]|uniref:Uncharacterized protein n=1 Tax=Elysia crispata TaxID=231223 RepID=A0AAE0XDH0_9GAST|nr:hypothetical protein RRG08_021555 [Elysia crispata]